MPGRLDSKVTLITGTGYGQGRAAARLFAREGAIVVGCDIHAGDADETLALVRGDGGAIDSTVLDLLDGERVREWIDRAAETYGRVDVLYNNAAAAVFAPWGEMDYTTWRRGMAGEVDVLFWTTHHVWPHFLRQGGGSIINTASIVGSFGIRVAGHASHAAAKGAVLALTRQLAAEGGPHRIRVNAISPGPIVTDRVSELFSRPEVDRVLKARTLLPEFGTPDDVAYCALYLASDESAFVTGANLCVDGGGSAI